MFKLTALVPATALLISLAACGTAPAPLAPAPQGAVQNAEPAGVDPTGQPAGLGAQALPVNYRVRYIIDSVQSTDTEDVSGADEFYTLGTLAVQKPNGVKVSRSFLNAPPIDVNDHAGEIHQLGYVMFDEVVPANAEVYGQMAAYDEDCAKDWAVVGASVMATANTTAASISSLTGQAYVSGIVGAATGILNVFMSGDKDDVLGNAGLMSVTANGARTSAATLHMFKNGSWYSNWNYYIKYHVEIKATTNKPTL